MGELFELSITHRPEKGASLHHTFNGDRDSAVAWLRAEADQLAGERDVTVVRYWQPERSTQDDPIILDESYVIPVRDVEEHVTTINAARRLRIGAHPMALTDLTEE